VKGVEIQVKSKRKWAGSVVLAGVLVGAGCYVNLTSPMSYRSATRTDALELVELGPAQGKACAKSYLGLVILGDAGYQAAVAEALSASGGVMLYDVRSDTHLKNYFGIYARECTIVHGVAVGPAPAAAASPVEPMPMPPASEEGATVP